MFAADLEINLNGDLEFILKGTGQEIDLLRLHSPSGSLVPDGGPVPFGYFGANTPHEILLWANYSLFDEARTPDLFVAVDGVKQLRGRWNPRGARDITYEYRLKSGEMKGPFRLPESFYREPAPPEVTVTVNGDAPFVLHGDGIELAGISFASPSGSLTGYDGSNPSPFAFHIHASPNAIASGLLGSLTPIDGSVNLSTGWNPLGQQDVTYEFGVYDPEFDLVNHRGPFPVNYATSATAEIAVAVPEPSAMPSMILGLSWGIVFRRRATHLWTKPPMQ